MNKEKSKLTKKETKLKNKITKTLKYYGFNINPHLSLPADDKQTYRKIQHSAKMAQISEHKKFLLQFLNQAKEYHLDGKDIIPEDISLEMRQVRQNTLEAKMFRWWNLVWWSMPYQSAYGRQMRFILWDTKHDMPFGLMQLQSPLLQMRSRDQYLDIPRESLDYWANMSMNAQRIGALPPYNDLIGGKMAALALTTNEIRDAYKQKYKGRKTVMRERVLKSELLFITTTSAFGPSSIYDRLRYKDQLAAFSIGYTQGTGTFHMPASLTREIYSMLEERGVNTSTSYGRGPSRKVKLFKEAFTHLGLNSFYTHGIKREVYFFPLVKNIKGIIHDNQQPLWINRPFEDTLEYWKNRWAIPRAERIDKWRKFDANAFFLKAEQTINTNESIIS